MAKKLKQYYFQHDAFAREDPKIVSLRIRHGSAGYGVYFMLLEYLFSQEDYMSETTYNTIGYNLHESASLVKSVVEDFGLFTLSEDGKWFHSESFSRRMASIGSTASSRSEAARKAALARWGTAPDASAPKNDASRMRHACKNDAERMRHAYENDANNIREDNNNNINNNARARVCEDFQEELLKQGEFWETASMRFKKSVDELKAYVIPFGQEVVCKGTRHNGFSDYRRHFFDWLRIQLNNDNKPKQQRKVEPSKRGRAESDAVTAEDFARGF